MVSAFFRTKNPVFLPSNTNLKRTLTGTGQLMKNMHKILVIEDNDDIRENLEELLELANYQVSIAENGAIGIEKATNEQFDLIICDISMPAKDGYEVFETLNPILKAEQIPFMFLTASAQERDIAKGKVSGADAYLTKPFQVDHLLDTIENLLK